MTTLYKIGTITFTNGSTAIVGVGTTFNSLVNGDPILAPDGTWHDLTITDDLNASLDGAYAGTTATNSVNWVIFKSSLARDSVRTASKQLSDITTLYRDIINLTGADQTLLLDKATTTDRAGSILQRGGIDLFQVGAFQDDDFSIRYLLATTWTKALDISATTGGVSFYSQLLLGNILSPAQFTATVDDFTPAGVAQANVLRLTTDAQRTLTGLSSGVDGRVLAVMNVGAFELDLEDEGGTSLAANRFSLGGNLTIAAKSSALLIYDGSTSRWRQLAGSGAGGTAPGAKGWSPILAYVSNGAGGIVAQIADWTGGEGVKPTTGAYIGATGLVSLIASAISAQGPKGDQVQFRLDSSRGGWIQWSYVGTIAWTDLLPFSAITGPIGPAGIIPRGDYSTITSYLIGDVVDNNGSSYISLVQPNLNNSIAFEASNASWALFARGVNSAFVTAINLTLTNATTQATAAATSATAAASSATAAAASATGAASSATAASGSAATATTQAAAAATSATAANTSKINAGTSEANAASSATGAASSATATATSATGAATSATAAATSATGAAATLTNFNNLYLGSFAGNPTVNNTGGALVTGNLYFNSGGGGLNVYNGGAWVSYTPSSGATSVFGRTGVVVAAANDYTFAQIGSKPTTISGYGITDATIDNLSIKGADIVSAATLNLDTATGNFVHVTGATAITAITLTSGRQRTVYFTGAPLLTNGASLVLPGGVNIQAAAGDVAVFVADGTTVRCTDYCAATQASSRVLIEAAPFDALAYNNILINGSMAISQELGTAGRSTQGYVCDGWFMGIGGSMVCGSWQQPTGGPPGIPAWLGLQASTAEPSLGAGDYTLINQFIEGYRIARLGWGAAGALPITLGFWTCIHRAGTYSGSIRNSGNTRSYVFPFTQNVSDTWEYKTVTIPGDTTGTWLTTNGMGMGLGFTVACGTTLCGTANTWNAGSLVGVTGTTNGVAATSDVFRIAGVVMLPGTEAPSAARSPLLMLLFDQELLLCKRYWESTYNYGTSPGATGISGSLGFVTQTSAANFSYISGMWKYAPKRATPTITAYSPQTGAIGYGWDSNAGVSDPISVQAQGMNSLLWYASLTTPYNLPNFSVHFVANARL